MASRDGQFKALARRILVTTTRWSHFEDARNKFGHVMSEVASRGRVAITHVIKSRAMRRGKILSIEGCHLINVPPLEWGRVTSRDWLTGQ